MSGRELASDRPDELRHPASLTKLMTLYLTFSALDSGRLSLGDALPVSTNALNAQPTKMGVTPGGGVTVRDAVMGLVTRSANDAAVVLGRGAGRRRGRLRPADDAEGAPARHELDGVPQRLRPAQPRAGHDGARHGETRPCAAARFPALLSGVLGPELLLPRPPAREPQPHAGELRRRRRPEDRLHRGLGLQPRDVGDARQSPPDRRRDGRRQRRPARPPDGRPDGPRLRQRPVDGAFALDAAAPAAVGALRRRQFRPRRRDSRDPPGSTRSPRPSRPAVPPPAAAPAAVPAPPRPPRRRRAAPTPVHRRSAAGSSRSARSAIRGPRSSALERASRPCPTPSARTAPSPSTKCRWRRRPSTARG